MICWFLLVPAGVPVLVSLLSAFFPQERGSVPSWFAGSSWFWLGFQCLSPFFSFLWFRCLCPFFSLLSFLRTGVLFQHDLLVPLGSGWGSGACLPSSLFFLSSGKGFCSIMVCLFLLVPAGVPVLVSLLPSFFPQERGSVASCYAGSSWFRLGFRVSLLSFLRKGVLFHHDLLVPSGFGWGSGACFPSSLFFGSGACLPSSLFLVLFHHDLLVPPCSGWASGACLPSSLFFGSGACLPSSLFFLSSGKGFCSSMICWFLLVPAGVPVLVSLLLPFFLSSGNGFCSIMICWFLLVPAEVPVLVSLLLSFLRKGVLVHHGLLAPPGSGWGSGACLPSSPLLSFFRKWVLFHHDLLVPLGTG